ncbi:LVIVD repeat-containing protein [Pseudochelatococcus sp. B33]
MTAIDARNVRLIAQDPLEGFGGIGEGMVIQTTASGRRIMWLAHEGPPKNFTGVDVTDPRKPKVIVQTELPHGDMRSNSLDLTGDILAVCYQTLGPKGLGDPGLGLTPAGIELFDVSVPETPKRISYFDCSGPHSMGVHQLWFVDGEYIHCSAGSADFQPRDRRDCQFYRCIDVRNPSRPEEVGRWWYPGTREGDKEPAPRRHPRFDTGFRAHNTNVYPERPDRVYLAYLDGGVFILDIADKSAPKVVAHWNPHPPFNGFTHTVLPLFERELLIVTDESIRDSGADAPKLTWIVDARCEDNLVPLGTFPMPPVAEFGPRGGRFGSHNLHENRPGPSFRSDTIIFSTLFSGGLRVYDIADPLQPLEIGHFVPPVPNGSPVNSSQINDVYVDERAIVYAVERFTGGLYILETDI